MENDDDVPLVQSKYEESQKTAKLLWECARKQRKCFPCQSDWSGWFVNEGGTNFSQDVARQHRFVYWSDSGEWPDKSPMGKKTL